MSKGNGLMAAVEARAVEMLGLDERAACAICYVCWVMQIAPPVNPAIFLDRVKDCQRVRQSDQDFDKAVGNLVTYAIHYNARS